jgi:hypothetical protein
LQEAQVHVQTQDEPASKGVEDQDVMSGYSWGLR